MFWSKLVTTLGKIQILLGVIVSLGLGAIVRSAASEALDSGISTVLGVVVGGFGIALTFMVMASVMMFCELCQNVGEGKRLLEMQYENNRS